jgi:hypothetical protein
MFAQQTTFMRCVEHLKIEVSGERRKLEANSATKSLLL